MATEIQITIAIIDTEPENPLSEGIMMREHRTRSLIPEDEKVASTFALAQAMMNTLVAEAEEGIREQLETAVRRGAEWDE